MRPIVLDTRASLALLGAVVRDGEFDRTELSVRARRLLRPFPRYTRDALSLYVLAEEVSLFLPSELAFSRHVITDTPWEISFPPGLMNSLELADFLVDGKRLAIGHYLYEVISALSLDDEFDWEGISGLDVVERISAARSDFEARDIFIQKASFWELSSSLSGALDLLRLHRAASKDLAADLWETEIRCPLTLIDRAVQASEERNRKKFEAVARGLANQVERLFMSAGSYVSTDVIKTPQIRLVEALPAGSLEKFSSNEVLKASTFLAILLQSALVVANLHNLQSAYAYLDPGYAVASPGRPMSLRQRRTNEYTYVYSVGVQEFMREELVLPVPRSIQEANLLRHDPAMQSFRMVLGRWQSALHEGDAILLRAVRSDLARAVRRLRRLKIAQALATMSAIVSLPASLSGSVVLGTAFALAGVTASLIERVGLPRDRWMVLVRRPRA